MMQTCYNIVDTVPTEAFKKVLQNEGDNTTYIKGFNCFKDILSPYRYTPHEEILQLHDINAKYLHDVICKVPSCSFRCGSLQSTSCKRGQAFQVELGQSPRPGSSDSETENAPPRGV